MIAHMVADLIGMNGAALIFGAFLLFRGVGQAIGGK